LFKTLFLAFILVPLIEIAVFIQVGEQIGLFNTLIIVILTAIAGTYLLRQQGLQAFREIQVRLAHGQLPAIEMVGAMILLVAGAMLLTPGFVTDLLGLALMMPIMRNRLAAFLIRYWQQSGLYTESYTYHHQSYGGKTNHHTIEGDFERED